MSMQPDRYAVFGQPIKHSKSPEIHRIFAKQTRQNLEYTAQEVSAETFELAAKSFFKSGGKGLNCTVPLKELAWKFADLRTERAETSKAVNTLIYQSDGLIRGDNTDGVGLVTDLTGNQGIKLMQQRILIIGAGGATRGILWPLLQQDPACIVIANRTILKAESLARELNDCRVSACGFEGLFGSQFDLILNATSASLSNQMPALPEALLANNGFCYDLAYGNEPTPFVLWGRKIKAQKSLDGLGMLVEQAAEAFYLWRGVRPETKPVIELLNAKRHI